MNIKILEQLTFGFEIEGFFKKGMDEKLNKKGKFKIDGSVHDVNFANAAFKQQQCERVSMRIPDDIAECEDCVTEINDVNRVTVISVCDDHEDDWNAYCENAVYNSISSEYNSAVYRNFQECLNDLKKFETDKTHIFNDTCGLHFHVGMKEDNWQKLYGSAESMELQKILVSEALQYCECQNKRLTQPRHDGRDGDYFCKPYKDPVRMIQAANGNNVKYSFMNFHPRAHTLEFRFLSPCAHKVENVKKLISTLTSYLGKDSKINVKRMVGTYASEKQELVRTLPDGHKTLYIHKALFKNFPYWKISHPSANQFVGEMDNGFRRILKPWEVSLFKEKYSTVYYAMMDTIGTKYELRPVDL